MAVRAQQRGPELTRQQWLVAAAAESLQAGAAEPLQAGGSCSCCQGAYRGLLGAWQESGAVNDWQPVAAAGRQVRVGKNGRQANSLAAVWKFNYSGGPGTPRQPRRQTSTAGR